MVVVIIMPAMLRNLDISLLRTFVTVSDHGSMTAAAHALFLTQSAVSQQVARLEDLTGALFQRGSRLLSLTPRGERLLVRARQIVSLNDELWAQMSEDALSGEVRLGAPPDLLGSWLPPVLRRFGELYPKVDVMLVCQPSPLLRNAIEQGQIDLALIEEPQGQSQGETLALEPLVWVGARGGAAHLKRPLPVSMVSESCAFRPLVLDALAEAKLDWRTVLETGTLDTTLAMVGNDIAVSVNLRSTIPDGFVILAEADGLPALPTFAVNLFRSKGKLPAPAEELAKLLKAPASSRK